VERKVNKKAASHKGTKNTKFHKEEGFFVFLRVLRDFVWKKDKRKRFRVKAQRAVSCTKKKPASCPFEWFVASCGKKRREKCSSKSAA